MNMKQIEEQEKMLTKQLNTIQRAKELMQELADLGVIPEMNGAKARPVRLRKVRRYSHRGSSYSDTVRGIISKIDGPILAADVARRLSRRRSGFSSAKKIVHNVLSKDGDYKRVGYGVYVKK